MQMKLCSWSSISPQAAALLAEVSISSEVQSDGGTISAPSHLLNVRRANLSISATPDRFDVAKGDEITWTIQLENDGEGTAYNVVVNASLDSNLQPLGVASPEPDMELCLPETGRDRKDRTKS